jgi:hypothetical protein
MFHVERQSHRSTAQLTANRTWLRTPGLKSRASKLHLTGGWASPLRLNTTPNWRTIHQFRSLRPAVPVRALTMICPASSNPRTSQRPPARNVAQHDPASGGHFLISAPVVQFWIPPLPPFPSLPSMQPITPLPTRQPAVPIKPYDRMVPPLSHPWRRSQPLTSAPRGFGFSGRLTIRRPRRSSG